MRRFAVISFKGHEEFNGFEPQLFDDPVNGKGIRLLRYRVDRKIDVYYEEGINPDQNLSIGAGINEMEMTHFEQKVFEVTEQGLQLHLVFTDAQGRKNDLMVMENSLKKYPVPVLAPIGGEIDNPDKMFFVYMTNTDFAYYKTTKIKCSLDDQVLEPVALPMIIKGNRTYLVRYSSEICIVALNSDGAEPLCFEINPGETFTQNNTEIYCNEQGKVEYLQIGRDVHTAKLYFPGGFPNLLEISDEQCIEGPFEIHIASKKITAGQYRLNRQGNKVHVELGHFGKWIPKRYPMAYKMLFTFVKTFKIWPTYFSWKGIIDLDENPGMSGSWENSIDHKTRVI
jgi:hypothetical protein